MIYSERKICLIIGLIAIGLATADARSVVKHDTKPNYYQNYLLQLEQLRKIPFVGDVIGPYVQAAKNLLTNLDRFTDGNLSTLVNGIMPCNFNGTKFKCQGTIDKEVARSVAKKLLSSIPPNVVPPTITSVLRLASDMI